MTTTCPKRALLASALIEAVATGAVLFVVVASGARIQQLSPDNEGLQLLVNSLATVAALIIAISIARGRTGAYLNPAAVLHDVIAKNLKTTRALSFVAAQTIGATVGVLLANTFFSTATFQVGTQQRAATKAVIGEVLATAILLKLGTLTSHFDDLRAAATTSMYVGIGFWVTPSTALINPAATIARSLTSTYAGIQPASAGAFIGAQLAAAIAVGTALRLRTSSRAG